jgi:FtsP/CotA-like multicopper oxidase with cupredoxin domain
VSFGFGAFGFRGASGQSANPHEGHVLGHAGHALGAVGEADTRIFDPRAYLTSFNFSHLPEPERSRYYRETVRPDGSRLREYEIFAVDREIEVAPGVKFAAWTYNGQVPGPTIRATEGDTVRVRFVNQGSHPHTMHFHGWHPPDMDGSLAEHQVVPGGTFVYEFEADPFGLHLYHCHAVPLKRHIHKGLYGPFIIDPKGADDTPRDEFVMVMNAFDTNFDNENEIYAVNTLAHYYMHNPIPVTVGKPVRIFLINITEFDLLNSFHLHGMFFDVFRTGTSRTSSERTDTLTLCQGERAILETTFRYPGDFMFHAHQSEFAELGWMGLFRATGAGRDT